MPIRPVEEEGASEEKKEGEFENEDNIESGERVPRKLHDPKLPSEEDIKAHSLTHLPYRSWCVHCVRGKGKSMAHRKQDELQEHREIHVDYCFMGGMEDQKTKVIVVAKDRATRMVMSSVVPLKGASHEFPARRIRAFVKELGMEHVALTLKGDQEPALRDLMHAVARVRAPARTMFEESPVGSSASNGVVERGVQTIGGQIRVIKDALEGRLKRKVPGQHNIIAWLVEFAAVLVNRYEVGHDGKTPYERLRGKNSKLLGMEFGEKVNFRRSRLAGKLAKLDCLWEDGIFLGYRSTSGEVIIGTKGGVLRTRTVSRKPEEHRWAEENLDMVGGMPWKTSPEDDAGEMVMPAIEIPMEIEEPDMKRPELDDKEAVPRRLYIRTQDVESHGVCPGCKGCIAQLRGARGIPHTEACRKRLTEILAKSSEGRSRVEAAAQRQKQYAQKLVEMSGDAEQEEKKRRVSGEQPDKETGGSSSSGLKRDRGAEDADWTDLRDRIRKRTQDGGKQMIEEQMPGALDEAGKSDLNMEVDLMEEYMEVACEGEDVIDENEGEWQEPGEEEQGADLVDGRTGEILDPKEVRAARSEELAELERRVYVKTDLRECWEKTGRGPIGVRWVDVHKGGGVYRSRLVAKDFRPKSKVGDIEGLYASMPPLELVKLLVARAATESKRGRTRKIMLIDIGKAHLYAPVEGNVYVDLAPEKSEEGKCARLLYTLYGMRTAASSWEKEYTGTLEGEEFLVGRASACTFYHAGRDIRIAVHGDDFVIEGEEPDLRWVEQVLRRKYPVKMRGILGPDPQDDKELSILNRKICWKQDEVTFQADGKHVEKMLEDMNMQECKASSIPGVKEAIQDNDDEELGWQDSRTFRSVVARANYLAQDRPDIRFSVKELCRCMSKPSQRAWKGLKKLCRYLKGHPEVVQTMPIGTGACPRLDIYVDSDWAGCQTTRKSTNGGAVMWGGTCLKTWSTTQTVVAMSSGEAEYYAAVKGCAEGLAIKSMCKDLGIELDVRLWTDSTACKGICNRAGIGKLKHIDVQLLWLQDAVRKGRVELVKVRGDVNPADLMTKHLDRTTAEKHLVRLGFIRP
jgi:hypothetical protein